MAMPDNTLIAATTEEASSTFSVESGQTATIIAVGLDGEETVAVQILAGTAYVTCYDFDLGTQLALTEVKTPLTLKGPGHYRVVKSTTTAPASVHVNK